MVRSFRRGRDGEPGTACSGSIFKFSTVRQLRMGSEISGCRGGNHGQPDHFRPAVAVKNGGFRGMIMETVVDAAMDSTVELTTPVCSGRDHLDRCRTPVPAEGHADQVDRFVPVPVFFSIVLFTDLVYGLLGGSVPVTPPRRRRGWVGAWGRIARTRRTFRWNCSRRWRRPTQGRIPWG